MIDNFHSIVYLQFSVFKLDFRAVVCWFADSFSCVLVRVRVGFVG